MACSYLRCGYYFWTVGWIPEGKDPQTVDRKLIEKYDIDVSKWERARRKQNGLSNVRYLRHDRFFVLMATHGTGRFFENENARDSRISPIRYAGYSIRTYPATSS